MTKERERAYSPWYDALDDHEWSEIKTYLVLLCHFVEATAHFEGNAEEEGNQGMRAAIWEVYSWLQAMWIKTDEAIAKETAYAAHIRLGTTPFKVSPDCRKTKLTEYWERLIGTIPYYSTAVVLTPGRQIG